MNLIETFHHQNPWRRQPTFRVQPFFYRSQLADIEKWISEPDIVVLIGPRQSGKTTILYKLIENLLHTPVQPDSIFYFNCDNLAIRTAFDDIPGFIRFIEQMTSSKSPYIFIDEVQRIENPGLFLKQLYDLKLGYKIIVSGSSSLEIRSKIKESLTGRKIQFSVLPFDFGEFITARGIFGELIKTSKEEIIQHFDLFERTWGQALKESFSQYLRFGGYPRQLLTEQVEKKQQVIAEIFDSYVKKDVSDFLRIENISGFNRLTRIIAITSGQIINRSNMALNAGINQLTVEKYVQILQDTFVVQRITPFFTNKLKELVKNPKIYFIDPGLHNHAVNNFNDPFSRTDQGFLQEQFVLGSLRKMFGLEAVKFWRMKSGSEVDFVVENGKHLYGIECKSLINRPQLPPAAKSFIKQYSPTSFILVNSSYFHQTKIDGTKVIFLPIPWFDLLAPAFIEE